MAGSKRKGIRLAIEQRLIPELLARGFVQEPETSDQQLKPFGNFVRRGDHGVDIVAIYFNKNRTSHFHFHVARSAQPLPTPVQWPWSVRPNFVVWRRGLIYRRWFGVRKRARDGISADEYDAAVRVAIRRLEVVERVLATNRGSLYVEEFPQGLRESLPYWTWCLLSVLVPLYAVAWALGWLWRHL